MRIKEYLLDRLAYLVLLIIMIVSVLFFLLMFKVSNALIYAIVLVMLLFSGLLIGYDYGDFLKSSSKVLFFSVNDC